MTEEHSTTAAHNAANAERRAAQTMDLGGHKVTLCIAVVAYLLYLILPYAGPAPVSYTHLTLPTIYSV